MQCYVFYRINRACRAIQATVQKGTNTYFPAQGGGDNSARLSTTHTTTGKAKRQCPLAISQSSHGGRRKGFLDEIWTRSVPGDGSRRPVVPFTPGRRARRPTGHSLVLAAAGWTESGSEWRRETQSGCRWVQCCELAKPALSPRTQLKGSFRLECWSW